MTQKSRVTIATARKVIEHHFEEKPRTIKQVHGGLANFVYEARLKHREIILRISDKPEKLESYRKEQWTIKRVAEKKVPTPKVLDVGSEAVPFPYMILEKVPGQSASEHPKRIEIIREMGSYAARINAIPTSDFGHVYDWASDAAARKTTWKKYLRDELNAGERIQLFEKHQILTEANLRRFKSELRKIENWRAKSTLSHGDVRMKNVLVNKNGQICAILDWENSTSNFAPYWELSLALHDLSIDEKEAFLEGYGLKPKEYSNLIPAIRALNILNYCPFVQEAIEQRDKKTLERLKARLNGCLDFYSL